MTQTGAVAGGCAIVVLILVASWLITAAIIFVLWNWLVPGVFNGPVITYWQALVGGILIGVIGRLVGLGGNNSGK